jgi:hypothetical protein
MEWEESDKICVFEDRKRWRVLAKTIMSLRLLRKEEHLLSILATGTFWIRTIHLGVYVLLTCV